jgi:hypothetical protein
MYSSSTTLKYLLISQLLLLLIKNKYLEKKKQCFRAKFPALAVLCRPPQSLLPKSAGNKASTELGFRNKDFSMYVLNPLKFLNIFLFLRYDVIYVQNLRKNVKKSSV